MNAKQKIVPGHGPVNINRDLHMYLVAPLMFSRLHNHSPLSTMVPAKFLEQGATPFCKVGPQRGCCLDLVQLIGVGREGSGRKVTPCLCGRALGHSPRKFQELCCLMMLFYNGI